MRLDQNVSFGWTYKEGYGHYEMLKVQEGERKGMKALYGISKDWGVESIPVLPLNGWRGRNLAEKVLGERNDGLWTLGTSKLVRVDDLLALPDWDGPNERFIQQHSGMVAIEVVVIDPGYAQYIQVTQLAAPPSEGRIERIESLARESYQAHQQAQDYEPGKLLDKVLG